MHLDVAATDQSMRHSTRSLLREMVSPLCGLNQRVGFIQRSECDPRIMTAGGELAGVHVLHAEPPPGEGFYHIGGAGVFAEEALIRVLGETLERYAQFMAAVAGRLDMKMSSHDDVARGLDGVTSADKLQFFSREQLARPGFPYVAFDSDMSIGWVKAVSALDGRAVWVPAQLAIVGYKAGHGTREPRLLNGVTTGTAAHTEPVLAARNALLELVQIDSAVGHWYSAASAARIALDHRTARLERFIARWLHPNAPPPEFYALPNPDLPGMTIACLLRAPNDQLPAAAVGLGCDLRLENAMHKALLEGAGVYQLAKLTLYREASRHAPPVSDSAHKDWILDLDHNVALHARLPGEPILRTKFDAQQRVRASDLPPDIAGSAKDDNALLVDAFRATGKDLVWIDLTTPDVASLGFVVVRVWSPDTLSLPLPSLPPLCHPRFAAYGGACHEKPHPYP